MSSQNNNLKVADRTGLFTIIGAIITGLFVCNNNKEKASASGVQNVQAESITGPVSGRVESQINNYNNYFRDSSQAISGDFQHSIDSVKENLKIVPVPPANVNPITKTPPVIATPAPSEKPRQETHVISLLTGKEVKFFAMEADPYDQGVVFSCNGSLTIDKRNEVLGTLDWRVHAITQKYSTVGKAYANRLNEFAIENVKGYFDPSTNKLFLAGYSITGPQNLIKIDQYELEIIPAYNQLVGKNLSSDGTWNSLYNLSYSILN